MRFPGIPDETSRARSQVAAQTVVWPSKFGFLSVHNGIRPQRTHWLLGTSGSGKTTLTKAIIADSANQSEVLVFLTEESVEQYSTGIVASGLAKPENVKFATYTELPKELRRDKAAVFTWFESRVVESGAKLVFLDNLTTSLFYTAFKLDGEIEAVNFLADLCKRCDVSLFIVIHTAKGVTDNQHKMISGEDVRGTNMSFIMAEYFYIIQRFAVSNEFMPILTVAKHRDYDVKEKTFLLEYYNGIYIGDGSVPFKAVNDIFLSRNVLGKRGGQ